MKVVIANQPRIVRECLAVAIGNQRGVEVVTEAANTAAILRAVQQHKPVCVILSLEQRSDGPRVCRAILAKSPGAKILAIGPRTLAVFWHDVIVRSERKTCCLRVILDELQPKRSEEEDAVAPAIPSTEGLQVCG